MPLCAHRVVTQSSLELMSSDNKVSLAPPSHPYLPKYTVEIQCALILVSMCFSERSVVVELTVWLSQNVLYSLINYINC